MACSRILMAGAAALPLMFAPALAQETVVDYAEAEDGATIVELYGLSVDEMEDMNVYGEGGEQIGEVEEVLTDATGSVAAVAVETEGFLGIGDEDVVVPLDRLELLEDRFVTSLTEDELEEMPEWDDD